MSNFQENCAACNLTDETVWEVIAGVALCERHQEEWFMSSLSVKSFLNELHNAKAVERDASKCQS